MSTTNWVILLMLVGVVVAVMEMFIPSGGVLGVIAAVSFLAAILLVGFEYGFTVGISVLTVAMIVFPLVGFWLVRWWPNSPMGRRILPDIPDEDKLRPYEPKLASLVGKVGKAKTMMLPSGAAVVEGRTVNAMSEGLPIEPGQLVRVVKVVGNQVIVRPCDEEPEAEPESRPAEDDLSQPIDSLGLDPLDDLS